MDFQTICQTVFISLIIIFLCHYFFYYLQASFTEPKVKDMINKPNEKYETIMKVVNSRDNTTDSGSVTGEKQENIADSTNSQTQMKNELSNFISVMDSDANNSDAVNPTQTISDTNSNNFQQGLPIPSNNFDNQELMYSVNDTEQLPDSTPIDQLQATQ